MDAVRTAVLAVNHYGAADVPELRARMSLISATPELAAAAALHYDAWERAIIDFVAARSRQPADSLYPLAVGRATLATCRAAYERWAARADADLGKLPRRRIACAGSRIRRCVDRPRAARRTDQLSSPR